MKFYITYICNVCKQGLAYRFDYIAKIIGNIFTIVVQYYIWKALLMQNSPFIDNTEHGLKYIAAYITISAVINSVVKGNIIGEINEKIRSGSISMDLVKPFGFMSLLFCNKIAKAIYQFLFLSVPLLIFSIIFFRCSFSGMFETVWGVTAAIGGFIIMFLMEYFLGLLGFWFQQVWILERFLNDFIRFFSGAIFPIWVFPESIQMFAKALPFQYIYYQPIIVFIGGINMDYIYNLLIMQLFWIIILWIMCKILWFKSVKRITIQGG